MNKDLIIDVSSSIIDEPKKKYTTTYEVPNRNRLFQILSNAGDKLDGLGDRVVDFGRNAKSRLADALLGKEIEEPQTIINPDGTMETGVNNGGRTGGLVSKVANFVADVPKGAYENMTETFTPQNWAPNKTKGLGYRLGEALGTGARLLDNSFVRGALAYGLSKYNGDFNPLEQGLTATVTNLRNKTNDKLYRQDLALNGIDTSDIRGFIDNNTYGNLIRSQQIRDNAEWRKLQNETMQDMRNREFEYRKKQDAIENAQNWEKIKADKEGNKNGGRIMPANSATALSGTQQGIQQMDMLIKEIPNFAKKGLAGPVGSLRRFNPYDADAQAFQQYVNTYKQVIGKGLEGGVLRKEDEAKYEKIIPRMGDTEEVLMRKAQQLQQMLIEKYNTDLQALYNAGYNTGNFNYYGGTQTDSLGIL